MKIAMIAAMANNRVIGKDNKMPWHLSADLKHFKKMTLGKPVVMGRKTFESIGRPLPERKNIVISRTSSLSIDGVSCVNSFDGALAAAGECDELVIIGGGQLYQQLLPQADILYLTIIDLEVEGDTFFPQWDEESWALVEEQCESDSSGLSYRFLTLCRKT